jgi:hypothetical protein
MAIPRTTPSPPWCETSAPASESERIAVPGRTLVFQFRSPWIAIGHSVFDVNFSGVTSAMRVLLRGRFSDRLQGRAGRLRWCHCDG